MRARASNADVRSKHVPCARARTLSDARAREEKHAGKRTGKRARPCGLVVAIVRRSCRRAADIRRKFEYSIKVCYAHTIDMLRAAKCSLACATLGSAVLRRSRFHAPRRTTSAESRQLYCCSFALNILCYALCNACVLMVFYILHSTMARTKQTARKATRQPAKGPSADIRTEEQKKKDQEEDKRRKKERKARKTRRKRDRKLTRPSRKGTSENLVRPAYASRMTTRQSQGIAGEGLVPGFQ
jgi:hypothetical protein